MRDGARPLLDTWRESVREVDGLPVGEVVVEMIERLEWPIPLLSRPRPRRRLRVARRLARSAGEWGWQEPIDGLLDRFDVRRRWSRLLDPAGRAQRSRLLCTSTYQNTSTAILRYSEELPEEAFMAWSRWRGAVPWRRAGVGRTASVWNFVGRGSVDRLQTRRIAEEFRSGCRALRASLPAIRHRQVQEMEETLSTRVAPELAAFAGSFERVLDEVQPNCVAVGNEFSFCDRAALLVAKNRNVATAAFAHGVFDYHYETHAVLSDTFVAWGKATASYICRTGLTEESRVLAVRPRWSEHGAGRSVRRDRVVVFTQPVEFVPHDPAAYFDGLIELCRGLRRRGVEVVVKPHPLDEGCRWSSEDVKVMAAAARVGEALEGASAVVVLDSTVVVDALLAGVPVVGVGWCGSTYGEEMERLGWLRRARGPEEAEGWIAEIAAGRAEIRFADPLEGERPGDRERLRSILRDGEDRPAVEVR